MMNDKWLMVNVGRRRRPYCFRGPPAVDAIAVAAWGGGSRLIANAQACLIALTKYLPCAGTHLIIHNS
jgi:hypothetical protein